MSETTEDMEAHGWLDEQEYLADKLNNERGGSVIITIVSAGKYPGTFKITPGFNGVEFVKPSSKCKTGLVVGQSYEVNLFKPEDKKTVYVTEAILVDAQEPPIQSEAPPTQPSPVVIPGENHVDRGVYTESKVDTKVLAKKGVDDKMSKEDWAQKDLGIKWLACVKASAVFNAQRPDVDIVKVINDARLLYSSGSDGRVKKQQEAAIGNVNDPYKGL